MKPMLTLAAAMPGHPNGIDRGGGSKCQVFHNYDGKKRPRGASGLVRGGCFKTGAWEELELEARRTCCSSGSRYRPRRRPRPRKLGMRDEHVTPSARRGAAL